MTTRIEVGQRYGRLEIVSVAHADKHGRRNWLCRCDCGNDHLVAASNLRAGVVKSCGCLRATHTPNLKHGHKRGHFESRAYRAWVNVKRRCNGENLASWGNYGGRGISYDPSWEKFENFLADMGEPPEGMEMDRRDNDGPYCKSNCRWVPRRTQTNNRRRTLYAEFDGKLRPLGECAELSGVPYDRLLVRLKKGWTGEKLFSVGRFHKHGFIGVKAR